MALRFTVLRRRASDVIVPALIWINLIPVWCSVDAESGTVLEDNTNCSYTTI
jgi:hypothetical protein